MMAYSDSIMKLYRCNKTVLQFNPHGAAFINGYATNAVEAPRSAFVDLQGKIVAVFDQRKQSEEEVWAIVENKFVGRLKDHLKKYLSLTDTVIEILGPKKVYWDLDSGELFLTEEDLPADASEEDLTFFRVKNNFPLQGVDFDQEMILNVSEELVSYTKGCYLGQEIVARVHYRSWPPKKLVVKMVRDCTPEEAQTMTSRAADPATGEICGFVFESNKA